MALRAMRRRVQILQLAIHLYKTYRQILRLQEHGGAQGEIDRHFAAAGREIRETANGLYGAMVKAGQFLSLREDLFPEAFIKELQQLQDKVPPVAFSDVRDAILEACRQPMYPIFNSIDPIPVASGSVAQVHHAKFTSGQTAAIKVLRPDIERLVAVDLATLRHVARITDRIPTVRNRLDLIALHKAFAATLTREMDMRAEAGHMKRLRQTLASDERIVIPKAFEAYTTTRVLVMEWIEGTSIRDTAQLQAWRVDRQAVRDALLGAYVKQLLVTGFVHLDPHPGNLAILPDGSLALLDFGMVAEYTSDERAAFRDLLQRAYLRDMDGVVRILQNLGFLQSTSNAEELARGLQGLSKHFTVADLRDLFQKHGFRLEARFMLLIRCLGMMKTAMTTLTPDETNWLEVLSEHVFPIMLSEANGSIASV